MDNCTIFCHVFNCKCGFRIWIAAVYLITIFHGRILPRHLPREVTGTSIKVSEWNGAVPITVIVGCRIRGGICQTPGIAMDILLPRMNLCLHAVGILGRGRLEHDGTVRIDIVNRIIKLHITVR